ncbi:DUF4190 domain-containing protein, partial [Singulisphaera rosea]
ELAVPVLASSSGSGADVEKPAVMSGMAIASLAMGMLFFFMCVSGIPAIIMGCVALRDIGQSRGQLRGRRSAIAGIVLGTISCVLTVPVFLGVVASLREISR